MVKHEPVLLKSNAIKTNVKFKSFLNGYKCENRVFYKKSFLNI